MKKKMNRVMALLLCAVMLLTTNHAYAYAAEGVQPEQEASELPEMTETVFVETDEENSDADAGEITAPEQSGQPEETDAVSGEESSQSSDTSDEAVSEPEQAEASQETAGETVDGEAEEPDDGDEETAVFEAFDETAWADACGKAEAAFADLAASKDILALIYLTDACEVREEADDESAVAAVLKSGHTVYVKSVRITEDQVWYGVSFWLDGTDRRGYVEESYLAHADEDWTNWRETYLLPLFGGGQMAGMMMYGAAGSSDIDAFPAAFQEKLQKLKNAHPNWTFVPVETGLDFHTAVSKEMGDKSWIWNDESNRKAGYVGDATGQSKWSYATEKAVSYYMDTQNYLDDTHIFAFEQLTYNASYHSEEAVQNFLNGTFMKGNLPDEDRTFANAFFTIGKEKKVNPNHLAARVRQEQGQGTSAIISGTYPGYEGYYNYFNIGASGSNDAETIKNGLEYAKKQGWKGAYKSLSGGAGIISSNYILKGQDTLYLQKFNVAPGASNPVYTHQYMQNIQATWSESSNVYKAYKGYGCLDNAFVFKIPVYKNMPNEIKAPLERIELNESSLVLRKIGTVDPDFDEGAVLSDGSLNADSIQLKVVFVPADTTEDKTITWKSSDPKVAVVDEEGVVTSVNKGTAVITATAANVAAAVKPSASCEVKVIEPPKKVIKCNVVFWDESGRSVLKTVEGLNAGTILKESDFPDVSVMETEGRQFVGWYTETDGKGEQFTADMPVYEQDMALYPYFVTASEGFIVVPVGKQVYTGSAIKPVVTVYDAETYADPAGRRTPLVLNTDYTVSYKNNKKVNAAGSPQPTIIIKGKGNYSGKQEIYFDILPASLKRSDVSVENVVVKYTGKVIKAAPVVMRGTKKLVKGTDYTVSYPAETDGAYKLPGKYALVITGKGGYTGEIEIRQIITKGVVGSRKNIRKAVVNGLADKLYTGSAEDVKQSFTVTLDGQALTESPDGVNGDYVAVYKNINKAGTATLELRGIGDYTGTCKKTFKIAKADLQAWISQGKLSVDSPETCPYVKGKVTPDVTVSYTDRNGKKISLVKGVDYTVSYKNHTKLTTGELSAEERPVILIKGKGSFTGTVTRQFVITDGQFENTSKLTVEAKDVVYKDKAEFYKTTVTIRDANDKALKAGTDYSREYAYYYEGTPVVKDAVGNPVNRQNGEAVDPADRPQPGTVIRVCVKAMGAYAPADGHEAVREAAYRIIAADIGKARVTVKSKTYLSGRPVTLTEEDLTVTLNGAALVYGKDYVIDETSYRNNVRKGTASVVIRGVEAPDGRGTECYGGSKTVKYRIGSRLLFW